MADQDQAWGEWKSELRDLIDAGRETVVVEARLVARGRQSAIPIDRVFGVLVTVQKDKIVRTRAFNTVQEALEAVGLPE